ncbi:hypothetical protein GE061_008291 [Apolygus lucorum]|uniref:Uncharacterized protein n=1 Tax=Apolygus lucorum TaxID=248454 RepID=A0A6A4IUB4_APOLU|nr:hypothetical protein GE061_008291 [Apolygus lucorum]
MASISEEWSSDGGTPRASNRKRERQTSSSDESIEGVTKKHKIKPLPRKRCKKAKRGSTSSRSSSSKTDQHHKSGSTSTDSSLSSSSSPRSKPVRRVSFTDKPAESKSKSLYRRFLRSVVVTPSKPHFVISGSARLLVTGLSNGATEEDVANIFGSYGQRQLVRVHYNRIGMCTGTAEVRLESKFLVCRARQDFNNEKYTFRGRRIFVQQISTIPRRYEEKRSSFEDDD